MRNVGAMLFLLACGGSEAGKDAETLRAGGNAVADADRDQDDDGHLSPEDCDDADPLVHPGADETYYDGIDADCAGDSDFDADLDGEEADDFGGTDCDDANPDVSTAGTELCNGTDDDCDGAVDDDAADAEPWWLDADLDAHGDPGTLSTSCSVPPGAAGVGDDCDDLEATVYPGAPMIPCDGHDNDCDPATNELPLVRLDGVVYPDLPSALAAGMYGNVVELCESVYALSDLRVTSGIVLRGIGGSAVTVIDAGGVTPALRIDTSEPVVLEGLTLTNGLGVGDPGESYGGGLLIDNYAIVDMTDLVITGNRAGRGAGLEAGFGTTLSLTDCRIEGNVADSTLTVVSSAGGMYVAENSDLTLTSTWISGNTADECGGASFELYVNVVGDGASGFDCNASLALGGGGVCMMDNATRTDLDVTNNRSAAAGGGIEADEIVLDGVTVSGNTAVLDGAGMSLTGTVVIRSSTIADNVADGDGGGLHARVAGTIVTIQDSVVTGNEALSATAIGGAALVSDGAMLESVSTDWGTGALDNSPDDVGLLSAGQSWSWGGSASFQCADGVGGSCL